MEAHADPCSYGCDKREKLFCEACKTHLSTCSRHVATKKAWGCPCCVTCFESLEEWSHHVSSHPVQNEKVLGWSFSTMIWSLLRQPYLSHKKLKDWEPCNWSTLRKEASQSLRNALERQEVSAAVRAHADYFGLDGPAALAKYALSLGTTGKAHPREVKTSKIRDTTSYYSPSPSGHIANVSTESPHYQSAVDLIAHRPAASPLPAAEATFVSNIPSESEASSSFRERVSGQANCQLGQSRRKTTEPNNLQNLMLEDRRHPPAFLSDGQPESHHMSGFENRHVLESNTNHPSYFTYPPVMAHDGSNLSLPCQSRRGDATKPARPLHNPDDSESRRLQPKKSQANLHARFTYNRDPTLVGDQAHPLPLSWQDPHVFSLDYSGRGLTLEQSAPQRPQTASSRPVTPARSEMSQGSWAWTQMLNTSSPSLPGVRYPVAMSLSGPPSDVDMSQL